MQEQAKMQHIPVKIYRTNTRLMVAAPMPGIEPEDIEINVMPDGLLIIHGEMRGMLKDVKELLVDEWSMGGYHREVQLQDAVDGERANVTYGNGVVVVALPLSEQQRPARLTMSTITPTHGGRTGNSGQSPA